MDTKEQAKLKIQSLIEKYERAKTSHSISKYSEEETKKDFISPLLSALGWAMDDRNEVSAEESQSSGRLDYGFYLEGRPKFYLEAKSLKADLHREEFANQAVRYSWNKGVIWAVLTDFESIKVFNSQDIDKSLGDKLFFEISYNNYITRFNQLWLLSRNAFVENLLDKEAERYGKKLQKISVTALLYKDLNLCREILTNALSQWNPEVDRELIDEGVQKLLDRLIFLRVAEDRGIEPKTLIPLVREWNSSGRKQHLYQSMIKKFRELDAVYNSNLFSPHPFEQWEEYSDATEKVIKILYGKQGYYEYDFQAMPADVLGSMYENYLGYKLEKSKKGLSISKDARKRKEHGIYYTPDFIVDYIVKHALKPILDQCVTIEDLKQIKVLDPACGSGSFLIKALEVIYEKYLEFGSRRNVFTKYDILLNNIYGVDLDPQAVEITRLNLLISALDQRMLLPGLEDHIKNGNSLISGSDEKLEKYFSKDFRDKKPFNWKEEFPEVFKQGGFDVVVGNPPWGANIDDDLEYFSSKYPASTKGHKDTYKLFIDMGVSLLHTGGSLGFIVPNTFLYQPRFEDVKKLVNRYHNLVVNLGEKIFTNVELPSCILILKKIEGTQIIIDIAKCDRSLLPDRLSQVNLKEQKGSEKIRAVILKNTGLTLDQVLILKDAGVKHQRIGVGKNEKGKTDLRKRLYYEGQLRASSDHPLFVGSDINRYVIYKQPSFFLRGDYKEYLHDKEIVYFDSEMMNEKDKIVWRQTADKIRAMIIGEDWIANTLQLGVVRKEYKDKLTPFYVLGIMNSAYIDYLYRQNVLETGKVFPQVKLKYLRNLPFVIGNGKQLEVISNHAKKLIDLSMQLNEEKENSDKWILLRSEIVKTDTKLDEEVCMLYGLTEKEIEIVERRNENN